MPDHSDPPPPSSALRPTPTAATLSVEERTEVARAARTLHAALDELGPWLRAQVGRVNVAVKDDDTPVSPADVEASERLDAALHARHPTHAVLSEEADTTFHGVEWTWVVDPIDGTANFVAGMPYWSVSVALLLRGHPVLAVVDAPPVHQRFVAVRGEGARRDGRLVRVRAPIDLDGPWRHTPVHLTPLTINRATGWAPVKPRIMGSAALDLALVAAGTAGATVSASPKVWDVAAGVLLVQEAGGAVATHGAPSPFPLVAGRDHARAGTMTLSGPDPNWIRRFVDRIGIRPPSH